MHFYCGRINSINNKVTEFMVYKEDYLMAIKTIEVMNVMVFNRKRHKYVNEAVETYKDSFKLDFCDGINVIIGENGVGKTTLLKMIYAATQWSFNKTDSNKSKSLIQYFSNNLSDFDSLKNLENKDNYCYYKISDGEHNFEYNLSHEGILSFENWQGLNIQSVFIPTTEMLSHSKGFLAMNQKYKMPFDGTQIDIIVNASLPETRVVSETMVKILEKISAVINGTVIYENDTFYVLKKDGNKVDFSLEAEGFRKLGLIWKLIRNGLLEAGTVLLWDEPEANLNPELYPLVVDILLELEKNGVQIFVATHSYNFAKYLEIRRKKNEQVLFHDLYKVAKNYEEIDKNVEGEGVFSQSAYKLEDLKANRLMSADIKLLDEIYKM